MEEEGKVEMTWLVNHVENLFMVYVTIYGLFMNI